jgi:hypothetical protein
MAGRYHHEREIRYLRFLSSVRPEVSKGERDFLRNRHLVFPGITDEEEEMEALITGTLQKTLLKTELTALQCWQSLHL